MRGLPSHQQALHRKEEKKEAAAAQQGQQMRVPEDTAKRQCISVVGLQDCRTTAAAEAAWEGASAKAASARRCKAALPRKLRINTEVFCSISENNAAGSTCSRAATARAMVCKTFAAEGSQAPVVSASRGTKARPCCWQHKAVSK